MPKKNGYFKLQIEESETSIIVYPAVEGGDKLKIDEVMQYLNQNNIAEYSLKDINRAISYEGLEPQKVKLMDKSTYQVDEIMSVQIAANKMFAIARFYSPSNGGNQMSSEEIKKDLAAKGIVFGINEDIIRHHILEPHYCTGYMIAKGTDVTQGTDAFITYNFNLETNSKPKVNENGTVDFHQLDNINHIKKGDILAIKTPEVPGISGTDIMGKEVRPKAVDRATFHYGRNIEVSENGLLLLSMVDGHVTLEGEKVFVSNTFEVPANVDVSTGDIKYDGNVCVRGNVLTGYKVEATGDIEVMGLVEGATLIAGGNIVIHHGIQGMMKARLVAGGNIISVFIESTIAQAGGFISTDAILHSRIVAKGDIVVQGRKGTIIGGHVCAGNLIEARSIGSQMGTTTTVEVGVDASIHDKLKEVSDKIESLAPEKTKLEQLISLLQRKRESGNLTKENALIMNAAMNNLDGINKEIDSLTEQYNDYKMELENNTNAKIKVYGDILAGTKIVISGDFIIVNDSLSHCQYIKSKGEIKAGTF